MTFPLSVASTCASGYALHEDKHKDIDYDISCEADAKLAYYSHGKRTNRGCRAIDCGTCTWPLIKNANVSGGTRFGETILVECTNGRSTTRSYLKMHAKYDFACQADGQFGTHADCERVECPTPMDSPHASHNAKGAVYFQDRVTHTAIDNYTLDPEVAEATYPNGQVLVFLQEVHYACKSGSITYQNPEHDGKNQKFTS